MSEYYIIDAESEGSTRFRNPRARGCSDPSVARALLTAVSTEEQQRVGNDAFLLTVDFTLLRVSVSVECKRSACYATLIVPTFDFASLQIAWRKHAER